MNLHSKNFNTYPKFRHNLWTTYKDNPDVTILTVSHGSFEVPTEDANNFLAIRSYCTGFNTIEDISRKSGVSEEKVKKLIEPLIEADILHLPFISTDTLTHKEIFETLAAAARIWSEQLADTCISRKIFLGQVSKTVVLGWLLETYHYVKNFPGALKIAANHASGDLKKLLINYAKQEQGHENFILQSLLLAGLTRSEVEESIPLVSTRMIDLLLKELFSLEPLTVLIVAGIIEADDFDQESAKDFSNSLTSHYGLPSNMLEPFFEHVKIDSKFGHHKLLDKNKELFKNINVDQLHDLVNKIHDIKHAFDLQKLEIEDYYSKIGNYFPRQKVDFFAI